MENTSRGQPGLCSIEVMMPGQLRKWFHQVFFFLLFSFAGTVTQYLILSFLPYLLGYGHRLPDGSIADVGNAHPLQHIVHDAPIKRYFHHVD